MIRVSLLRCKNYSNALLKERITNGLENIGLDLHTFSNMRVGLKPNLLTSAPARRAVITHPEFFRAVVQIVKEHGGKPVLIESPAFYPLEKVIKKVGYREIIDQEHVAVADVSDTAILHNSGAERFKRFDIIGEVFNVDMLLNLPKFKTHGATYITAAVKNLFGTIPGLNKSQWHLRVKTKQEFSEILLDLYGGFLNVFSESKTLINIVDAIVGLEGEGPGLAGKPKEIGAVIVGTDAIAVDFIGVQLTGLDFNKVSTITSGVKRNLGVASFNEIELIGDSMEDCRVDGFVPTRATIFSDVVRWPLNSDLFKNLFVERPVPQEGRCTLCYQCREICPANAIEMSSGKRDIPDYDYKNCVRCYCCLEICPEAAIELKRGKLQWIMGLC
jgi:uncharacterized protein (DUF362 family)/Pyruvate/2-oxoacid:ferredoxin oxidoreductase delta subunit